MWSSRVYSSVTIRLSCKVSMVGLKVTSQSRSSSEYAQARSQAEHSRVPGYIDDRGELLK